MTSPVTFEIWDRGSGNRLGEYATEAAARETMRTITDADPGEIGSLVLLEMDGDGRPSVVGAKEDFGGHGVLGDD